MFVTTSARIIGCGAGSQSRHSFALKSLHLRLVPAHLSAQHRGHSEPDRQEAQMPYRTMGWIHANVVRLWREAAGQGTVEYVGLMLLLATLLTGVVAAAGGLKGGGIANEIVGTLKKAITDVAKQQ
jgi:hypothetical protein